MVTNIQSTVVARILKKGGDQRGDESVATERRRMNRLRCRAFDFFDAMFESAGKTREEILAEAESCGVLSGLDGGGETKVSSKGAAAVFGAEDGSIVPWGGLSSPGSKNTRSTAFGSTQQTANSNSGGPFLTSTSSASNNFFDTTGNLSLPGGLANRSFEEGGASSIEESLLPRSGTGAPDEKFISRSSLEEALKPEALDRQKELQKFLAAVELQDDDVLCAFDQIEEVGFDFRSRQ